MDTKLILIFFNGAKCKHLKSVRWKIFQLSRNITHGSRYYRRISEPHDESSSTCRCREEIITQDGLTKQFENFAGGCEAPHIGHIFRN